MSSTIGITNTVMYSVLCLVMRQRICIFPAETLLMLTMLDQNLSSKFVSMFNALFSKSFEAMNLVLIIFPLCS